MADKQLTAFITARKGFCYLTVKIGRQNFHIMRIRNYTLDAQDKRDMRRLYPDTAFDWKKIGQQLAEKREACRRSARGGEPQALPARRAPANRCTPSMTQSPGPSMPMFLPPAKARRRCLMPSCPLTARWTHITHTDVAENSAALVKTRILQQASNVPLEDVIHSARGAEPRLPGYLLSLRPSPLPRLAESFPVDNGGLTSINPERGLAGGFPEQRWGVMTREKQTRASKNRGSALRTPPKSLADHDQAVAICTYRVEQKGEEEDGGLLACNLYKRGQHLAEQGWLPAAVADLKQALAIFTRLVEGGCKTLTTHLVLTLSAYGTALRDLGRPEERSRRSRRPSAFAPISSSRRAGGRTLLASSRRP